MGPIDTLLPSIFIFLQLIDVDYWLACIMYDLLYNFNFDIIGCRSFSHLLQMT